MNSTEIKYTPRTLKSLLIDMKDTSELMIDLAYSAVIFEAKNIAKEVLRLEEKMNTIDYHTKIVAILSARRIEEAEEMAAVIRIATSSEIIANAAGVIAKIVIKDIKIPYELKMALRNAEETTIRAKVSEKSSIDGKKLEDIKFDIETGMWIIAIRRHDEWIYDPDHSTRIRAKDVLFARGHDDGVSLFMELVTNKKHISIKKEPEKISDDFKQAINLIVEMKNMSELSVGLAYSALLFDNEDIAHEVKAMESEMNNMKIELQQLVLKTAKQVSDTNQLIGLLYLSNASELISDVAHDISDTVLRDLEPHPIISLVVRDSEEIIVKTEIGNKSEMIGKTLGNLKLETETGIHVMAIKREEKWIYKPHAATTIQEKDILISRGTRTGEEVLIKMCACQ
ncbi:MAG: potassium channel protein [Methanosarcinales archaeon]|jgi:uncharacterized protein with PhoU and TrkA domain|nr:potassium channel protein [Methanosarcinales archaeon]